MTDQFGEGIFDSIGDAVSSAVDGVGDAASWAETAAGAAASAVGSVASTISSATGTLLKAPYDLVDAIASGTRIDRAILNNLTEQVAAIREVAPYAQMIISVIPTIGPVMSGGISAGLALASGKPIDEALVEGVKGAMPGGPLAAAALEAAYHIAKGENVGQVALESVGTVLQEVGIPIPDAVSDIIGTGVDVAQKMVAGEPVDQALLNTAISKLPPEAQDAVNAARNANNMSQVADLLIQYGTDQIGLPDEDKTKLMNALGAGVALGTAERIQAVSWNGLAGISGQAAMAAMQAALDAQKELAAKQAANKKLYANSGKILAARKSEEAARIAKTVQDLKSLQTSGALKTLGKSAGLQKAAATAAQQKVNAKAFAGATKLIAEREVAKTLPSTALVPGQHGADIGHMFMTKAFDYQTFLNLRSQLSGEDLRAFDMAVSLAIGQEVSGPAPKHLTPPEQDAYFITKGMQGASPANKQAMMQALIDTGTATGAATAVKEIADARTSLWDKILHFFGLAS